LYYTQNPDSISKCLEILERAKKFTSDEVLYTTLGDCYKEKRQFENAEVAYLHAVFMVPNKLYPKFLLAKLYAESEQPENAKKMAWQIINFVPKINSQTTDEIKEETKKILQKTTIN